MVVNPGWEQNKWVLSRNLAFLRASSSTWPVSKFFFQQIVLWNWPALYTIIFIIPLYCLHFMVLPEIGPLKLCIIRVILKTCNLILNSWLKWQTSCYIFRHFVHLLLLKWQNEICTADAKKIFLYFNSHRHSGKRLGNHIYFNSGLRNSQ